MPANNFKLFDENKQNMLNDQEYQASQQRLSGVQAGIASSMLNNKFAYQMSLVAYAITQMMNANGYDATDALAVSAFVGNLSNSVLQKVIDKATASEARAGTNTLKWMTPALVKSFFDYRLATQTDAQAGSIDIKWMSPAKVKAFYSYMAATESMAAAGTDTTHWMSPKATKTAIDSSIRIGDIKATVRTDLGENWLLCNGDMLNRVDYPSLSELISSGPNGPWKTSDLWTSSASGFMNYISNAIYENGYYAVAGTYHNGSNFVARIGYSTSLSGPWIFKDIWTGTVNSVNTAYVSRISYVNGYYVLCGAKGSDNNQIYPTIAYSRTLQGPWTTKTSTSFAKSGSFVVDILYANGEYAELEYVVSGSIFIRVRHGTDLSTLLSSSASQVNQFVSAQAESFTYENGHYLVTVINSNSMPVKEFYYTTNLNSSWTWGSLWSQPNPYPVRAKPLYVNNKYIVAGNYSESGYNFARIAYSNSLSGQWLYKDLWDASIYGSIYDFKYVNGYYFAGVKSNTKDSSHIRIGYSANLDGIWTFKELWSGYSRSDVNSVAYLNGEYVACGSFTDSSSAPYFAKLAFTDSTKIQLPQIALSNSAYSYIKAKE